MDEAKICQVFTEMVRLLENYELENAALKRVFQMVEHEATQAGMQFNIRDAANSLITSPPFQISARQRFAKFGPIQIAITPNSLELALAGTKDIIAYKTGQPPPG